MSSILRNLIDHFPDLMDLNLTASIVILFVICVRQFLKGAPKIFSYALWGIVLLRLLVPVSIESSMSFVPQRTEFSSMVELNEQLPEIQFELPQDRDDNEWQRENTAPGEPLVQTYRSLDAETYLTFGWLTGIAAMLIYSMLSYWKLKRKVRVVVPLEKGIYIADDIDTPFVMGFFRPQIYLPGTLDQTEQKYIIAHPMQNHMSLVKDVRGCMTRFDPLTPEIVTSQSEDGLTYDELKQTLEECGMDINKVVFDGSRAFQNAFYADFEQGHYCWIPFQKAGLKAIIRTMDQQFHSPSFGMARKKREWESFYMMDVPLPMQIYDFERRYKTIEPDRVFSVWSSIHTHIDYSNGMWDPEVLNYVFSHAPKTGLPETDADGKVTIYRGMGEKSQPAEEAISWSTDPVCALWLEKVPRRYAIVRANEIMAKQSDWLISYVRHGASNSRRILEYAQKQGTACININDMLEDGQ